MNPYQKQAPSLPQLLSTLNMPDLDNLPPIILSVSPCRSGTTVMLRVMGTIGTDTYYQPLKNLLRWHILGESFHWSLPADTGQIVYLKETLGPYTWAESTFNPLDFLLKAGVPPHKIHLWVYGRHPLNCYASWVKLWHRRTDINHFVASYHTLNHIQQQAVELGIPTTTLVYEIFKNYPIPLIIKRLAGRFGLAYTPCAITGWQNLARYGEPASNISLPQEPHVFSMPSALEVVFQANEFLYVATPHQMAYG